MGSGIQAHSSRDLDLDLFEDFFLSIIGNPNTGRTYRVQENTESKWQEKPEEPRKSLDPEETKTCSQGPFGFVILGF